MNRRGIKSIKQFLIVGLLGVLLLSFLASFLINRYLSIKEINELYDTQLAQTSRVLQGLIDYPISELDFDHLNKALLSTLKIYSEVGEEGRTDEGHGYEGKFAIQIWDSSGNLLVKTPTAPLYAISPLKDGYYLKHYNGYAWYVFTHKLKDNGLWVLVGERSDIRDELIDQLTYTSIGSLLITGAIIAICLLVVIHFGLQPLTRLTAQLADRHIDKLEPVNLGSNQPNELRPLVQAINSLMGRVAQDLERERQFLGDVAHELRTPLAAIRLSAQMATQAANLEQTRHHLFRVIQGVDRGTHLVQQLLTLARLDKRALGAKEKFKLSDILQELIPQITQVAGTTTPSHEIEFEAITFNDQLWGYPLLIQIILRNLLENACRYSPQGSRIRISACGYSDGDYDGDGAAQSWKICIEDQGQGIAPEKLAQLGQRFFRAQAADTLGSGLGLSIVARITELLGATLSFTNKSTGGLRVEIAGLHSSQTP